jgi:hypothetical protein
MGTIHEFFLYNEIKKSIVYHITHIAGLPKNERIRVEVQLMNLSHITITLRRTQLRSAAYVQR